MKNLKKIFKKPYFRIVILIVALLIAFSVGKKNMEKEMTPTITSSLIKNKLVNAKELTTLKYYYTNVGEFENQNTFYGYKVPFTSKKFIVSYDGVINAEIDLDKIKVSVNDNNIKIKIPPTKILSHEIFEDSLKVFDERESIFNRIDIEDYNNFSKDQKKEVEKNAIKKGLLKEADTSAKRAIEDILSTDTILKDYNIQIITDSKLNWFFKIKYFIIKVTPSLYVT